MGFRLIRIEQGKELGVRPGRNVQFGEAFMRELLGGQCGKTEVEPRIVVVVQRTQLCENATEVYVAPVVKCKEESAFSVRIKGFKGERLSEGAGIDLAGIRMVGVDKLGVRLGRLGGVDLWRLDEGLKDLFGAGQWEE